MHMAISRSIKLFTRSYSAFPRNRLRACIVGTGPAGFYTAEKLLKKHEEAEVDLIDRLPTPFGLVRSGVAPDHPETKIVTNQFSRVLQSDRCSFFGNVSLGSSVSLSELRELYDVVVLAYGAESDRVLGVPGEDLKGIFSAREFVGWYNGHPDYSLLAPDLKSTDTAIILGQGNVALDVARILLRPTKELATTDVACHAITALEQSCIRKVYLVGRRGPVQAAFTAKELREILGNSSLRVHIDKSDLTKTPTDEEELKNNRSQRRVYELLSRASTSGPSALDSGQRELNFVFFRKPDRFIASDGSKDHVDGVMFEKTMLKEDTKSQRQIAFGTGQFDSLKSGMVLKSIGYKSLPVDGLPFDHQKGIVPNVGGRVLIHSGDEMQTEEGLYVSGWLKRGPTGIIATNLYCAEETVSSISEDIFGGILNSNLGRKPGREGLQQLLESRNQRLVPIEGWEKIDNEEKRRGMLKNKSREKLTTWNELLEVASS